MFSGFRNAPEKKVTRSFSGPKSDATCLISCNLHIRVIQLNWPDGPNHQMDIKLIPHRNILYSIRTYMLLQEEEIQRVSPSLISAGRRLEDFIVTFYH